jgi:ABC-type bacteriocin/lantibiotic exporter with double-glycine peptidase domain
MLSLLKIIFKGLSRELEMIFLFLNKSELRKLHKFIFIGVIFSFLDVIGIFLIGIIGALIFSILTGGGNSEILNLFLSYTGLQELEQKYLISFLSIIAVAIFILKSVFFIIQNHRLNFFLAGISVRLSGELLQRLFLSRIYFIQGKSREEISYALSEGAQFATLGLLTSVSAFVTESIFILIILLSLSLYNTYMLFALIFFGFIFFRPAQKYISNKTKFFSNLRNQGIINDNLLIADTINLFREIVLTYKQDFFVTQLESQRKISSQAFGALLWVQNLPRISIEVGTVLVIGLLGLIAILPGNALNAISFMLVFTVAISRIAPSILRIQQSIIGINSNTSYAQQTFGLLHSLPQLKATVDKKIGSFSSPLGDGVEITFSNVDFSFPEVEKTTIFRNLSLRIPRNSLVALVGPSGIGKSTFCDLITGFHIPDSGEIFLNDMRVGDFLSSFPGSISYLPQRNYLISGTISENVSLASSFDSIAEQRVRAALTEAGIWEFLESRGIGIHDELDNSGTKLSGGQQQRIGIARALYFQSKLIILDEPTSSLDRDSSISFFETIKRVSKNCTVLVVSHQHETIGAATHVVNFSSGSVKLSIVD